jgi:HK97 family phage major capsid protein
MNYFQSKQLREERGAVVADLRKIAQTAKDDNRTMTAEEKEAFDKLNDAQKDLQQKIESAERVETADSLIVSNGTPIKCKSKIVTAKDHANAFKAWAYRNAGYDNYITTAQRESADKVGLNIDNSRLTIRLLPNAPENLAEIRQDVSEAITGGDDTQNYGLIQGIEKMLLTYGGMTRACRVIRTANGNNIKWITMDDTANVGTARDKLAATTSTAVAFDYVELDAYSQSSGVFPVALETIEDSGLDLTSIITEALGERLARKNNRWYTTGAGGTEPYGICTAVAATSLYDFVDEEDSNTNWYDVLVKLKMSVDESYRSAPSTAYMFSDSVLTQLISLQDGESRPLWVTSMTAGEPDKILGKPYFVNNDMPDADAIGGSAILFGDLSKYLIRQVNGVDLVVLKEVLRTDYNAIGFLAFTRTDSALLNAAAIKAAGATSGSGVNCGG